MQKKVQQESVDEVDVTPQTEETDEVKQQNNLNVHMLDQSRISAVT
jgi:hypothetical protein